MTAYWMDTNNFVEASNNYYPFDFAPQFWEFLDEQIDKHTISCPKLVYDECIKHGNDDLRKWIRSHKNSSLFSNSDRFVRNRYREIVEYVSGKFEQREVGRFLSGADPWLIAHALQYNGKIVTRETPQPMAKKIKIPDLCVYYGVRVTPLFAMLRDLGFSFRPSPIQRHW